MSVFATDTPRLSSVVKMEFEPQTQYCRDSVVINDAAATIQVGTVLGKVTATGKYKVCQTTAVDGSQNPVAIYIADTQGLSRPLTLAATTDTPVIVLSRGPAILADIGLQFGAANAPTVAAVKTAFAALNPPVLVETGL